MKHVDYDWASEKAGGHGMCCGYNSERGLLVIHWIGSKPIYVIWWYNLILFFKMLKRIFRK